MSNSRPNIIVLITDDQGYGDLSCMGATGFRTPNIDGLANELSSLAMEWRGGIEERWERDYAGLEQSVQTSAMV
ncbi:MAG: sulfatase-like hydrolase/transferase [Chloroflexi bacterium]|nr:sulfatase-like hydrolase/transferase [Chloroflexota bacterium]